MKLARGPVIIALAGVLAGAGALAQEEGDLDRKLGKRISVEFKKVPFEKCLEALQAKSGVNVVASQKAIKAMAEAPVTLTLKELSAWQVIRVFARSCGLEAQFDHGAFILELPVKPDETWATLKVEFDDVELKVKVLRGDVPREFKREAVRRLLAEELFPEEDDEGEEEGEKKGGKGGGKGAEKPAPPAKGEQF